ncbi:hypothetical protein [Frigidibacter sp. SD6-1]|uniref:hypothetical protein n=1 Tax=Frigidibacter sp. SD6-1 TaxID=3032581 RepID=UPI0024DF8E14|nr:hypothetical protein [Frigidibacter sp. SD6-1]
MAEHARIYVDLPKELLLLVGQSARRAGLGAADYVASVLAEAAGVAGRSDLPAGARIRLAAREASDWFDLQHRLRAVGFVLRLSGDDRLVLCLWPEDRPLMAASAVGLDFADLALRFRADFPGHLSCALPASVGPPRHPDGAPRAA